MVLDVQLNLAVLVAYGISPSADLHASAPIGRGVHLMQAQIALARYGHAERAMREHFDTDQFSLRTCDMFVDDRLIDLMYLLQIQFSG